ncbi:MAG: hypothetical protein ACJ8GN_21495 [Longimicrobiaceae bacterium]
MKDFDAVAMTRRIRDAHAEQLAGATPEERIRFYREKAKRLHAALAKDRKRPNT